MREVKGNIWELAQPGDAIIITTNGTVKKNGECVMGRGIAKEAKDRFPEIALVLGEKIRDYGNRPHALLVDNNIMLFSFPVKHNWWEKADLKLIKQSANWFNSQFIGPYEFNTIWMPRPGCGNGGLNWENVRPLIDFLRDNFVAVTFE